MLIAQKSPDWWRCSDQNCLRSWSCADDQCVSRVIDTVGRDWYSIVEDRLAWIPDVVEAGVNVDEFAVELDGCPVCGRGAR